MEILPRGKPNEIALCYKAALKHTRTSILRRPKTLRSDACYGSLATRRNLLAAKHSHTCAANGA